MKFNIKKTIRGYYLYDKSNEFLINLGNITLRKENNKSSSYCVPKQDLFDYQGISNALCGRTGYIENGKMKGEYFKPLRITVIQMEINN